jgi:hypothetical protein
MKMDFDEDRAPMRQVNRIIWKSVLGMRGMDA